MKKWAVAVLGLLLVTGAAGCGGQTGTKEIQTLKVACAQSLEPVVKHMAWTYEAEHRGVKIQLVSGGSRELADKVAAEGDYDLFLAGGTQEMADVSAKQPLLDTDAKSFLSNRLVVVVPEGRKVIKNLAELKNPEFKRIAISDPNKSASGRYTREALETAGLWQELQSKLTVSPTVRQALSQVSNEAAEAGIVYHSDVITDDKVHLALEIPAALHAPIRYPMAVLKSSKHPDAARDFLNSLEAVKGKERFARHAFVIDPK